MAMVPGIAVPGFLKLLVILLGVFPLKEPGARISARIFFDQGDQSLAWFEINVSMDRKEGKIRGLMEAKMDSGKDKLIVLVREDLGKIMYSNPDSGQWVDLGPEDTGNIMKILAGIVSAGKIRTAFLNQEKELVSIPIFLEPDKTAHGLCFYDLGSEFPFAIWVLDSQYKNLIIIVMDQVDFYELDESIFDLSSPGAGNNNQVSDSACEEVEKKFQDYARAHESQVMNIIMSYQDENVFEAATEEGQRKSDIAFMEKLLEAAGLDTACAGYIVDKRNAERSKFEDQPEAEE